MFDFIDSYDLIIFDVDNTIVDQSSDEMFSPASMFFSWLRDRYDAGEKTPALALVSNQSVVGMRYWMIVDGWGNPDALAKFPDVYTRLLKIQASIPLFTRLYVCYAYRSLMTGRWSPSPPQFAGQLEWARGWMKPQPGMLNQAIKDCRVSDKNRILMIGDSQYDMEAAKNSGVDFMWSNEWHDILSDTLTQVY